jgi:hypothetical protein
MVFRGIPILGRLFGPSSLFPLLIANLVPSLFIVPLTTLVLQFNSTKDGRQGGRLFAATLINALCEPRAWVPIHRRGSGSDERAPVARRAQLARLDRTGDSRSLAVA